MFARRTEMTSAGAATAAAHLWDRVSVRHFAAIPSCVRDARRHAVGLVQDWGLSGVAESTELVVSELATNAAQASGNTGAQPWLSCTSTPVGERMALRLTCAAVNLVIEMWDGTATPPVRRTPDTDEEGGRGLLLVEALSQDWGYYRPWAGGKVVWCALQLTESLFSPAAGWVGIPGPPLVPPTESVGDRDRLRRVIDGLRALGGWYLSVDDGAEEESHPE